MPCPFGCRGWRPCLPKGFGMVAMAVEAAAKMKADGGAVVVVVVAALEAEMEPGLAQAEMWMEAAAGVEAGASVAALGLEVEPAGLPPVDTEVEAVAKMTAVACEVAAAALEAEVEPHLLLIQRSHTPSHLPKSFHQHKPIVGQPAGMQGIHLRLVSYSVPAPEPSMPQLSACTQDAVESVR